MNLRLPSEKLAGIYHLGRYVDKARLRSAGDLPEEYLASFNKPKGLDGLFLSTLGLAEEEFLTAVECATDEEIGSWITSRVSEKKISEWNELSFNLGRPGTPGRERFLQVLPVKYPNLPHDFNGTVFEAIAADEA